jgi:hypothetical protein
MTSAEGYLVEAAPEFMRDVQLLRAAAKSDPARHLHLYREVLRSIDELRKGLTDGHHALGYESGKGDLRDCVTAYLQADPQDKAGHRLVFREIGAAEPGGLPRRELLAVKPRQGAGNVYEHVCARLRRHPADRQPGLNRFGDRAPGDGGNREQRQAELDTKRAIAQAWAGQRPLASSRPLRGTSQRTRAPVRGPGPTVRQSIGSPSGTGWPERM